jgi:hypothetical protein
MTVDGSKVLAVSPFPNIKISEQDANNILIAQRFVFGQLKKRFHCESADITDGIHFRRETN